MLLKELRLLLNVFLFILLISFFYSCTNPIEDGSTGQVGPAELVYTLPDEYTFESAITSLVKDELLILASRQELVTYVKTNQGAESKEYGFWPDEFSSRPILANGGKKTLSYKYNNLVIFDLESKNKKEINDDFYRVKWSNSGKFLTGLKRRYNETEKAYHYTLFKINPETAKSDSVYDHINGSSVFDYNPQKNIYTYFNSVRLDDSTYYFINKVDLQTAIKDSFAVDYSVSSFHISNNGGLLVVKYYNSYSGNPVVYDLKSESTLYELDGSGTDIIWSLDDSRLLIGSGDTYSIFSSSGEYLQSDTLKNIKAYISNKVFTENGQDIVFTGVYPEANSLLSINLINKNETLVYKSFNYPIYFTEYYKDEIVFAINSTVNFYNTNNNTMSSTGTPFSFGLPDKLVIFTANSFIGATPGDQKIHVKDKNNLKTTQHDFENVTNIESIEKINEDGLFSFSDEYLGTWVCQIMDAELKVIKNYQSINGDLLWAPPNPVLNSIYGEYAYNINHIFFTETNLRQYVFLPRGEVIGWSLDGLSLIFINENEFYKKQVLYVSD